MIIKIIIIIVLAVVLGILLKFTIEAINENDNPGAGQEMQKPGGEMNNGMNSSEISYSASKEISQDSTIEEGEYESEKTDENAILVTGYVNVSLENINVNKTGDSDGGDNTSFYGTNSAILAKSGASLNIENITVNTDATGANGVFSYGGSATTNNTSNDGTNTTAIINLENNTIINNDDDGNFLRVQKDSWGNSGSNGGIVTLGMTNQEVTGNIVIDSISILDMNMKSNSYYEGTINGNNEAKTIDLKLDETSKIKLTGDSYVTSLEDAASSYSNIDFNGYKLYVNGLAIN